MTTRPFRTVQGLNRLGTSIKAAVTEPLSSGVATSRTGDITDSEIIELSLTAGGQITSQIVSKRNPTGAIPISVFSRPTSDLTLGWPGDVGEWAFTIEVTAAGQGTLYVWNNGASPAIDFKFLVF